MAVVDQTVTFSIPGPPPGPVDWLNIIAALGFFVGLLLIYYGYKR